MEGIASVISLGAISRNALANLASLGVTFLVGIPVSIYAARALGPAELGLYYHLAWLLGLLTTLGAFGMQNGVSKFVAEMDGSSDSNGIELVIGFGIGSVTLVGSLLTVVLLLRPTLLSHLVSLPVDSRYLLVLAAAVLPSLLALVLSASLRGLQRYIWLAVASVANAVVSAVTAVILVAQGFGAIGLVIPTVLGNCIVVVVIVWVLFRLGVRPRVWAQPSALRRRVVRYALPMGLLFLCDAVVWQRTEVVFLNWQGQPREAGLYGVSWGLALQFIQFLPLALGPMIMPLVSYYYGQGDLRQIAKTSQLAVKYMAITAFPLCCVLIVTAPRLIPLMYGEEYVDAIPLVQVLSLASTAGIIGWVGASIFQGLGRSKLHLYLGLLAAGVCLLLDFLLIPAFGAMGAAIAKTVVAIGVSVAALRKAAQLVQARLLVNDFLRVAGASIGLGIVMATILASIPHWTGLLVAGLFGSITYGVLLVLTGCIGRFELGLLKSLLNLQSVPAPEPDP